KNLPYFLSVIVLMFINWSLEARKWQLVINSLQKTNFLQALKAIFTGNSVAFFTPNRIGEYFGRMVYVEEGKRAKSIAVTVVCSLSQLLVTFLFGLAGLFLFAGKNQNLEENLPANWIFSGIWVVVILSVVLGIIYFKMPAVTLRMEKLAFFRKIMPYIRVLELFNATVLFKLLSLSSFRYVIFIIQYYILFSVFEV